LRENGKKVERFVDGRIASSVCIAHSTFSTISSYEGNNICQFQMCLFALLSGLVRWKVVE